MPHNPNDAAETNTLLRELLAEIRGLRTDLAGRPRAQKAANLQDLVDAIAFAVGDSFFTAKDLLNHAEVLPAERLKSPLHAAGGINPKCVGKLLSRLSRQDLPGWRVERIVEERAGLLWQVKPAGFRV